MKKLRGAWLALLFLWPLAGHAADVDIPELGIRLTLLPDAASKPQLAEQAAGYQAETHLGSARLSIFREDNPVPAGSDVAEPGYRAMLDARFGNVVESKSEGAPTGVGGHSAWTVVDAHESHGGPTDYICVTYVIVDEHLYRLSVTAQSSAGRPPEFDSLVKALSGIAFEQVRRANHG
jgi:hypothetical protein